MVSVHLIALTSELAIAQMHRLKKRVSNLKPAFQSYRKERYAFFWRSCKQFSISHCACSKALLPLCFSSVLDIRVTCRVPGFTVSTWFRQWCKPSLARVCWTS